MWDKPEGPEEVELDDMGTTLLAEPDGTRVMPSRSTLMAGAPHWLWLSFLSQQQCVADGFDMRKRAA